MNKDTRRFIANEELWNEIHDYAFAASKRISA